MKKNQALFSLKDKSKKIKWRLLQFSFGACNSWDQRNTVLSFLSFMRQIKRQCCVEFTYHNCVVAIPQLFSIKIVRKGRLQSQPPLQD